MVTTGTLVVCAKMLFALVPKDNRREMAKKVRGKPGAKCLIVFIRLRRSVTARAVILNPAVILKDTAQKSRPRLTQNSFRTCPGGILGVQSARSSFLISLTRAAAVFFVRRGNLLPTMTKSLLR